MRRLPAWSPALVVVAALAVVPSTAAATTVATTGGVGSAVREYDGAVVFSAFDAAQRQWRLVVREAGAPARPVAVAPSPVPFDADIGPDGDGHPELIYRRCDGTPEAPTGCDLYVASPTGPAGERPVRNANDPQHSDTTPTLWRGRIAWTREYGTGTARDPVVYTKLLTAPRSRPSTRLPGVPTRRCAAEVGLVDPPCGATADRRVRALELSGDRLGLIVGYTFSGLGGIAQSEVRLDAVGARSAMQVALLITGLNGQFLVGPSFTGGSLAWYRSCAVPERSCRGFVGPWRYRIATGTYARAAPGPIQVRGFADAGTRLYEVVCAEDETAVAVQAPTGDCPLDEAPAPVYASAAPPDLAPSTPPR